MSDIDPLTDLMVRTVYGEGDGQPAAGQQAITATALNRAKATGQSLHDVLLAPGQYQAWQNPTLRQRMTSLSQDDPAYQQILANISPTLAGGQTSVGGATNYLNRGSTPAGSSALSGWAAKPGTKIGAHEFYNADGSPAAQSAPSGPSDAQIDTLVGGKPVGGSAAAPAVAQPTAMADKDVDALVRGGPDPGVTDAVTGLPWTNAAQVAKYRDMQARRELDLTAPEGAPSHPFGLHPGDDPSTLAPYASYVDLQGNLHSNVPAGMSDNPLIQGLDRGVRDVISSGIKDAQSIGAAGPSNALLADQARMAQYNAGIGHDPMAKLGRFGGQAVPIVAASGGLDVPLALAGKGITAAAPALAPAADFLAGDAGGNLLMRSASGGARGALQGAEAGALTSATSSQSPLQSTTEGALGGGLMGSAAPSVVAGARGLVKLGAGAGNMLMRAAQPLTNNGQETLVNNAIRSFAEGGPTTADTSEIIPGSTPTGAQATANPGIAAATRVVRDMRPNTFAPQEATNDAARIAHLQGVVGNQDTIDQAAAQREATTAPLRQAALSDNAPVNVAPVVSAIDNLASGPAGQLDPAASTLAATRAKIVQPAPEMSPEDLAKFNGQVHQAMGGSGSPVLNQAAMTQAKKATGALYDNVLSQASMKADDPFLQDIAQVGSQARELGLDPSQIAALDGQIAKITDLAQRNGGTIPGDAFKTMTESASTLSRLQQGGGTLGSLAGDIEGAMKSALGRSVPPELQAQVDQANAQWKAMKTVEPQVLAASRANPGKPQVTPDQVLGAVTRNYKTFAYNGGGNLGDLATKAVQQQGNVGPSLQTNPAQLDAIRENLASKIDGLSRSSDPVAQQSAQHLQAVHDAITQAVDGSNPGYADYVAARDAAGAPIKAQTYLQGLRLTDMNGKPTLSAVTNGLASIAKQQALPGPRDAKFITPDQIGALQALQADLIRKNNETLGKSMGSPTFQNLATNNMMSKLGVPAAAAAVAASHHPLMAPLVMGGRLIYGAQNGPILDRLANKLIDPDAVAAALQPVPPKPPGALKNLLMSPAVRSTIGAVNDNYIAPAVIGGNNLQRQAQ